ncbi:MAG: hypothetical protein ACPGN3_03840 [Opitutales bacterium]
MPYPFYKLLHFIGIFAIYISYGGLIFRAALGSDDKALRKFGAIVSGIGLFLVLLGGFGMMAKMGYSYASIWMIIKVVVWVIFGGMVALINKKPEMNKVWFFTLLVLGGVASFAGIYKPFA